MKKIIILILLLIINSIICANDNIKFYSIKIENNYLNFSNIISNPIIIVQENKNSYSISWAFLDKNDVIIFYEYEAQKKRIYHDNEYWFELNPIKFTYNNKTFHITNSIDLLLKENENSIKGIIGEDQGNAVASDNVLLERVFEISDYKIIRIKLENINSEY